MGKIIAYQGKVFKGKKDIAFGVFNFPDRKKPSIGIREGNSITVYGTFKSDASADMFMDRLAEFLGIPSGDPHD